MECAPNTCMDRMLPISHIIHVMTVSGEDKVKIGYFVPERSTDRWVRRPRAALREHYLIGKTTTIEA